MPPRLMLAVVVALLTLHASLSADAQANAGSGSPQSGYTFHANSRVVLTDVTVTDRNGNPIHGLKASDFHVFDNNKPQEIASFEEHRRDDVAPPAPRALPVGVYSNDYLAHPPRVLNILFIDLTNIEIADQMYLNYQLGKFFDTLKPDEPIAIYARPGDASILLQSFTSNPALLRAAVRRVMPRFPPLGREYMDDFQTLDQIARYLDQLPGRKNVLWLSGGSTLFLRPGASVDGVAFRTIYDELESQRIAIYPIDVRGLTTAGGIWMMDQHGLMSDVAEATGGRAVYNNNGIAQAATDIVDHDGEYYTLTYSPAHFTYNNKWHKVRITVSGTNYTLSYRRGYFADGSVPGEPQSLFARRRLSAGGATDLVPPTRAPIIFEASIRPGAPTEISHEAPGTRTPHRPRKGTLPYTVRYSLPLEALEIKSVDGKWKVDCGAEIIALNSYGSLISHQAKRITFTLRDEAALHPAGVDLPLDQEIDLAKGDVYVYVAVFDMNSRRLGSLEIPYHVDTPKRSHDTHASE